MESPGADIPFDQVFDLSLNAISVHTIVLDAQGKPVDYVFDAVNRAFERLTGLKADDILGKAVKTVLPGIEPLWIDRYGQVALTGEAQTFTSYTKDLDRWYSVSAFQHKPQGFTVTFVDITEVKRVEEAVQRSQQRFQSMVWKMQFGVLLQGPQAEILLANPRALELLGLTEDQLLGKTSFDPDWRVIHEDGSPFPGETHPVPQAIATCSPVRNVVMGVFRPLVNDWVWLQVDAEPELDPAGRVEQVVCTFVDITERKQAVKDLQESRRFLLETERVGHVGGWRFSMDSPLQTWTEEVYRILEVEPSFVPTVENGLAFYTPESRPLIEQAVLRALERGEPFDLELEITTAKGNHKSVHAIGSADPDRRQVYGFFQDITARRKAEQEKEKLQLQLQQSQKMENLGLLAGGVAHDMNNVLAAILTLASAQTLRLPEADPMRRSFVTISKAAERGGKLVRSLLEFARQKPAEEKPLDLNALVQEEVSLLERTTFSQVAFTLELAPELPRILGDASSLTHALMNLCVNAVDALRDQGTLTLRTKAVAEEVFVEVEDTGEGMAPEVLERALDPFFTTKPVGKGTGLGLSLVYSTVQAHRGRLEIESQPGLGTLVRMRFPVHHPPSEVSLPIQASTPGAQTMAILLVDDDELILESLGEILVNQGHRVTAVHRGEDALTVLGSGPAPGVVLLDMNMPGLGGAGTLAALRRTHSNLPVLLTTGRVDQSALDLVAAYPAVSLLSKPFSQEELREKLCWVASLCGSLNP